MGELQIPYPGERRLVAMADLALGAAARLARLLPRRVAPAVPRRILLLRLERIGDLCMTLGAIRGVRRRAPDARIDLVVGSWNAPIASLIHEVDRVELVDAPWLARGQGREGWSRLKDAALGWRAHQYDLGLNFEGDIRSHALLYMSGAARRVGFDMAGGGPLLTDRVTFRADEHTATNAFRLVAHTFGASAGAPATPMPVEEDGRIQIPDADRQRMSELLSATSRHGDARTPLIAVHAGGGRAVKQWPPERFAEVASALARERNASIVLTGSAEDREVVDQVKQRLAPPHEAIDLSGRLDLRALAALFERCSLLLTGDTGPMHLAAAVATPVAAVFGPSAPARYAPLTEHARVVRIDLPCAPCNRIRRPPARCTGHTPDCLAGLGVDLVLRDARALLGGRS